MDIRALRQEVRENEILPFEEDAVDRHQAPDIVVDVAADHCTDRLDFHQYTTEI
jgi:hypothetical protein